MKVETLKRLVRLGEDSQRQFKADVGNAKSLASEMAALASRPEIEFRDDRDGNLFVATVIRRPGAYPKAVGSAGATSETPERASEKRRRNVGETSEKILTLMAASPVITIAELSRHIGVSARSIERNIRKLQDVGLLRRAGPAKGGRWEVLA